MDRTRGRVSWPLTEIRRVRADRSTKGGWNHSATVCSASPRRCSLWTSPFIRRAAAGAGASCLALLSRVRRQLRDDRRWVARPHRADRSARAGRSELAATQLAPIARGGVPAVPNQARRRLPAPHGQRACVCHDVRAELAGDPPRRVPLGRLCPPRAPLRTRGRGRGVAERTTTTSAHRRRVCGRDPHRARSAECGRGGVFRSCLVPSLAVPGAPPIPFPVRSSSD